jgi:hypothetical protein
MVILYNKQGISVDVPEGAVEQALNEGFTRDFPTLAVLIKNYNPNVNQDEIPVDIQGTLKQVEFILQNRSDTVINVRYGDTGSETNIPGGVPANGKLRFTAFSGTTQVSSLPTVLVTSSDSDNFVELEKFIIFTATQQKSGTITKVEFYSGARLLGTVVSAPYTLQHTFTATGKYKIYARCYSGTDYTTSNFLDVFAIPNRRQDRNFTPTVTLTAPNTGIINQAVLLQAIATDLDGTVNKVEFYSNDLKIGEDITTPYSLSYTFVTGGTYVVKARVYDNLGATSESNIIQIVISAPSVPIPTISVTAPSTANTNTALTLNATASITGDTIAGVQFLVNGINQGSADTTSPYSISWTPTTPGNYTITAIATGVLGGSATSAGVTVTVTTPAVPTPTISIANTTPKAGLINEVFIITATAALTGDTLTSVQFRVDGSNIGSPDTVAPYSLSHTFTTKGIKQLSAIALGSQGGTATSANYSIQIFDSKVVGGGAGAGGASLGADPADFMLFDTNLAGGNASTMAIFVGATQVGAFNYDDTSYAGKPFAYFHNATSTMYTGTIQPTVNFS